MSFIYRYLILNWVAVIWQGYQVARIVVTTITIRSICPTVAIVHAPSCHWPWPLSCRTSRQQWEDGISFHHHPEMWWRLRRSRLQVPPSEVPCPRPSQWYEGPHRGRQSSWWQCGIRQSRHLPTDPHQPLIGPRHPTRTTTRRRQAVCCL